MPVKVALVCPSPECGNTLQTHTQQISEDRTTITYTCESCGKETTKPFETLGTN